MTRFLFACSLLIASWLLPASAASAATTTITFSGTVTDSSSSDWTVFGIGAAGPSGLAVTGSFSFDPALFALMSTPAPGTDGYYNYKSSNSAAVHSVINFGPQQISVVAPLDSSINFANWLPYAALDATELDSGNATVIALHIFGADYDLTDPASLSLTDLILALLDVQLQKDGPGGFHSAFIRTTLDSVAIDSAAATPLPAALPLFAGGLGVIGFLARRRKQKVHRQRS